MVAASILLFLLVLGVKLATSSFYAKPTSKTYSTRRRNLLDSKTTTITVPTSRPDFVVDWDGTCVVETWPHSGEWLPGAVDCLRSLANHGVVAIHSLRISPFVFDCSAPVPEEERTARVDEIRRRLDEVGLEDVIVWPHQWGKPPGNVIIDDRAIHHRNWSDTMGELQERGWLRDGRN